MEAWVAEIAHTTALVIDLVAVVIIAIGSIEALWGVAVVMISRKSVVAKRAVWLRYARWLVAGLTFQLAADVVHTAVAPNWDDIGKLAAIAVIRTFLTFFLDRDMERTEGFQEAAMESATESATARKSI